MDSTTKIDPPVLLFDGVCNLCIGAVNFIIDQDALNHYKFASLQSQFAQKILLREQSTCSELGDEYSLLVCGPSSVSKEYRSI